MDFLLPIRRLGAPVATLAFTAILAGCSTFQGPATPAASNVARNYQQSISLSGRMSVRYQQNDKEQAIHGSFTWDQQQRQTVVDLLSPLGQTLATITIKPGTATLTQSGKPPRTAADVDTLTELALGWPLPVSGLRDWLQGFSRHDGGGPYVAVPADTESSLQSPDGWKISYDTWQREDGAASSHPKRIDLSRNTEQAGQVSIRIVIDTWQPR